MIRELKDKITIVISKLTKKEMNECLNLTKTTQSAYIECAIIEKNSRVKGTKRLEERSKKLEEIETIFNEMIKDADEIDFKLKFMELKGKIGL